MPNEKNFINEFLDLCSRYNVEIELRTGESGGCTRGCCPTTEFGELEIRGDGFFIDLDCLDREESNEQANDFYRKDIDVIKAFQERLKVLEDRGK